VSDHSDGTDHNYSGKSATPTIRVGDEWVTWRQTWCTCGQFMENIVIGQVKIPKDEDDK